jgi:cobalamin biosynthesis Mg chelatase CobN
LRAGLAGDFAEDAELVSALRAASDREALLAALAASHLRLLDEAGARDPAEPAAARVPGRDAVRRRADALSRVMAHLGCRCVDVDERRVRRFADGTLAVVARAGGHQRARTEGAHTRNSRR